MSPDVFASLCVLCVFERMDKDKRSLLDDQIDSAQCRECYRLGKELLHTVDQSSKLVVRFIAILERLRGDGIDKGGSNLNGNNTISPDAGHVDQPQQYSKGQATTYPWPVKPLGSMFDTYIDFSDLDAFLTDFSDIGEPLNQGGYSLPGALH